MRELDESEIEAVSGAGCELVCEPSVVCSGNPPNIHCVGQVVCTLVCNT
jgi:hypothetical protein